MRSLSPPGTDEPMTGVSLKGLFGGLIAACSRCAVLLKVREYATSEHRDLGK
jgi:hypothetical protein